MPVVQSLYSTRLTLAQKIEERLIDDTVLSVLLPNGQGLASERDLWDYKEVACEPVPPDNPTDEQRKRWRLSRCELAKDIVAFYNSYGGYIVFGVRDLDRIAVGSSTNVSIDDLIKYCSSLTGHNIELDLKTFSVQGPAGPLLIPVMLIPRRADSKLPAIFSKDGESRADGRPVFRNHDLYFRRNDECRPLDKNNPLEVKFLYQTGQRTLSSLSTEFPTLINNLGPEDPELVRFVGREDYLRKLWAWTTERYSEVKILSGLGGVGKTTIVRQFAEQVVERPCMGLTQLIWLTAKQHSFSAIQNKRIERSDASFSDPVTMLKSMLRHLAVPDSKLAETDDIEDLMDLGAESLQEFPSLVVFDDIDSLPQSEQTNAFQTIVQLFGRTFRYSNSAPSRAIITSRLELGAATRQLLKIDGLTLTEFSEYVSMMFDTYALAKPNKKVVERLHVITDGSPVFASSIVRLVRLGENMESALQKWKTQSGEDVRKFAFERELEALSSTDRNVLFALCLLKETTRAELKVVLDVGDQTISDNLDRLRQYHLITSEGATPYSDPAIIAPSSIQVMVDLVEKKVLYSARIRESVQSARRGVLKDNSAVGSVVYEAMAHLRSNHPGLALAIVDHAIAANKTNGDLWCLHGRCLLANDGREQDADKSFNNAYHNGSRKKELFANWIKARRSISDWQGILDILEFKDCCLSEEEKLLARMKALEESGHIAVRNRMSLRAVKWFRDAVRTAVNFLSSQPETTEGNKLLVATFAIRVCDLASNAVCEAKGDFLEICEVIQSVWDCGLTDIELLENECTVLNGWWEFLTAESRPTVQHGMRLNNGVQFVRRSLKTTSVW